MKKAIFIFGLIVFFCNSAISQVSGPNPVFAETSHDFGKISEDGGNVSYKFLFTNTGSEPVIVSQVKASCGCTTPDWSNEPIAPGAQGFVNAVFNPQGRPGTFNKSITVTTNAPNSPITLQILGDVQKKEPTLEEQYRFKMDDIRLKANSVNFGKILNDEKLVRELEFVNVGGNPVKVTFNKASMPVHISIQSNPETVAPGAFGKLIITYDAASINEWDYVNSRVNLTINDKSNQGNTISVSATIAEKFTEEQIKKAPIMTFLENSEFDFGTVKQGEVIEHVFKFTNSGKSDLIIRKIGSSCGCTVAEPKSRTIKPGQQSELKVVFNTAGKSGDQTKIITLIVNEPGTTNNVDNSRKLIKMVGKVEVKKDNR